MEKDTQDIPEEINVEKQAISDDELDDVAGGGFKETWHNIWCGGTDHGS